MQITCCSPISCARTSRPVNLLCSLLSYVRRSTCRQRRAARPRRHGREQTCSRRGAGREPGERPRSISTTSMPRWLKAPRTAAVDLRQRPALPTSAVGYFAEGFLSQLHPGRIRAESGDSPSTTNEKGGGANTAWRVCCWRKAPQTRPPRNQLTSNRQCAASALPKTAARVAVAADAHSVRAALRLLDQGQRAIARAPACPANAATSFALLLAGEKDNSEPLVVGLGGLLLGQQKQPPASQPAHCPVRTTPVTRPHRRGVAAPSS